MPSGKEINRAKLSFGLMLREAIRGGRQLVITSSTSQIVCQVVEVMQLILEKRGRSEMIGFDTAPSARGMTAIGECVLGYVVLVELYNEKQEVVW